MSRRRKVLSGLGLALSLPLILVIITRLYGHLPGAVETLPETNVNKRKIETNTDISLISWNIQYAGSRKHHFFYDGGEAVRVPLEDVSSSLEQIRQVLAQEGTDIALLQEIDRFSDRTQKVDQMDELRQFRKDLNWTIAPYHKVPYVPTPSHEHLGRVNLNLGILSAFTLQESTRYQLALLDEPAWRQYFNLKRAILESSIGIANSDNKLKVAVTHLSAFSKGDGTLAKQVQRIKEWMESQPEDQPWILAGDFNLLPPEDNPERLGDDGSLYADKENPITRLLPQFPNAFPDVLDNRNRTYLPFGAKDPDRKIDYIFYGGPIEIKQAIVLRGQSHISDHLPLKIVFQVRGEDQKASEEIPAAE